MKEQVELEEKLKRMENTYSKKKIQDPVKPEPVKKAAPKKILNICKNKTIIFI